MEQAFGGKEYLSFLEIDTGFLTPPREMGSTSA